VTSLALSIAIIAVAFVARDVALRVLADRARERGVLRGDAAAVVKLRDQYDGTQARIEALGAGMKRELELLAGLHHGQRERLDGIAEKVERLDGKDQMVAAMGRAKR
jgi:hypothetical protein